MSEPFDPTGNVVQATGANTGLAFLQGCANQGANGNAEAVAELKALGASCGRADAVNVSDEAAVVDAFFAAPQRVMRQADCVFANATQAGDPRGRPPA
jgi:hypothetical protein